MSTILSIRIRQIISLVEFRVYINTLNKTIDPLILYMNTEKQDQNTKFLSNNLEITLNYFGELFI